MYRLLVDFLSQKGLQTFLFWLVKFLWKLKILTVMTSLWPNDDIINQLNYTKLISLWFSTTPPNFIPLSLIVLELWAAGTFRARPRARPRVTPPPPPPAEPPSKSPSGIALRKLLFFCVGEWAESGFDQQGLICCVLRQWGLMYSCPFERQPFVGTDWGIVGNQCLNSW